MNLTIPSFLFGSVIAILLGSVYHLWQGGDWKVFLLAELASLLGFWLGHFLGFAFRWELSNLGPIYVVQALMGSVLALGFIHWLGQSDKKMVR
jgi:uncharacterized membrane protein YjjP (DUF1212 family)